MELLILDDMMGDAETVGTARFEVPKITVRALIRARVELHLEQMRQITGGDTAAQTDCRGGRGFGAQMPGFDDSNTRGQIDRLIEAAEAETLDEEIDLAATSEATFLPLTPLKGG
jgi:hypothetical protein